MLFSVVVPVYGVEKYLTQCVQSLQKQTYRNLEIILVDDGSPDKCPAMCDAFAKGDARIRVIHKENGGATSPRKVGARVARGQYICCVDSDDFVAEDYLEKMAQAAEELPDIICCGAYVGVTGKYCPKPMDNRAGYYGRKEIEEEIFPRLIQTAQATYFAPAYWSKAIKRELFQQQIERLDEQIKIGEDGACIIACVHEAKSMYVLPDCLYYYYDNPSSLTKSRKAFHWNGPKLIAEHLEKCVDLDAYDFRQQWYRKTIHELFSVVKSQFNRQEPYGVIAADIRVQLQEPLYQEAIENSRFEGMAGRLAHFALKYRLLRLVWLFNWMKH